MSIPLQKTLKHEVLSAEKETNLAKDIKSMVNLLPPRRVGDEFRSFKFRVNQAIANGNSSQVETILKGLEARETFILANQRLIMHLASKYKDRGVPEEDLIHAGTEGLCNALERFDPDKGFRFSTYSHNWIRQAMSRAAMREGRNIPVPYHLNTQINKIRRAYTDLVHVLGKEPEKAEIAEESGFSEKRVEAVLRWQQKTSSLNSDQNPDQDMGNELQIPDRTIDLEQWLEDNWFRERVENYVKGLSQRHRLFAELYYGLNGEQPHLLSEVALELNISDDYAVYMRDSLLIELRKVVDVSVDVSHDRKKGVQLVLDLGRAV